MSPPDISLFSVHPSLGHVPSHAPSLIPNGAFFLDRRHGRTLAAVLLACTYTEMTTRPPSRPRLPKVPTVAPLVAGRERASDSDGRGYMTRSLL